MNQNTLDILSFSFRVILGVIFLYAGIVKILDPGGFAQSIYNYQILPGRLINAVAIVLPWVEVLAGAGLVAGILIPGASLIVTGLLFVFFCALGISLMRGLDISCGCFSTLDKADPVTWMYLFRDGVLIGMGCFVFFFDQGCCSLGNLLRKRKT